VKTKDKIKTILDLPSYCDHENMKLIKNEFCVVKPKVTFT